MNIAETIQSKVFHLPAQAREEILEFVEQVEGRYSSVEKTEGSNGDDSSTYPLRTIANLSFDVGISDLAERHDFYSTGKLEG